MPSVEDNDYVIMKRNPEDQELIKGAESGENRTSVFDDSDYDEVLDFLMSPSESGKTKNVFDGEQKIGFLWNGWLIGAATMTSCYRSGKIWVRLPGWSNGTRWCRRRLATAATRGV